MWYKHKQLFHAAGVEGQNNVDQPSTAQSLQWVSGICRVSGCLDEVSGVLAVISSRAALFICGLEVGFGDDCLQICYVPSFLDETSKRSAHPKQILTSMICKWETIAVIWSRIPFLAWGLKFSCKIRSLKMFLVLGKPLLWLVIFVKTNANCKFSLFKWSKGRIMHEHYAVASRN